jgi:hypothetical protein
MIFAPTPSKLHPFLPKPTESKRESEKGKENEKTRIHAVNALLTPMTAMPVNAPQKHRFLLWLNSRLSPKSCRATLAMMPAVTANMAP